MGVSLSACLHFAFSSLSIYIQLAFGFSGFLSAFKLLGAILRHIRGRGGNLRGAPVDVSLSACLHFAFSLLSPCFELAFGLLSACLQLAFSLLPDLRSAFFRQSVFFALTLLSNTLSVLLYKEASGKQVFLTSSSSLGVPW